MAAQIAVMTCARPPLATYRTNALIIPMAAAALNARLDCVSASVGVGWAWVRAWMGVWLGLLSLSRALRRAPMM